MSKPDFIDRRVDTENWFRDQYGISPLADVDDLGTETDALTNYSEKQGRYYDDIVEEIHLNPLLFYTPYPFPVKSFFDPTPGLPSSPDPDDRYISLATANGWIINRVYHYDDVNMIWVEMTQLKGTTVWVEDIKEHWVYDGIRWRIINIRRPDAVSDFFNPTPGLPASPTQGDRYISLATANGWNKDSIYEFDSVKWIETIPVKGTKVWLTVKKSYRTWDGVSWFTDSDARFEARLTAPQSIPDDTLTTVIYDDEIVDPLSGYDPITGLYTIPIAGTWVFYGSALFEDIRSSKFLRGRLVLAGDVYQWRTYSGSALVTSDYTLAVTAEKYMNVGDTAQFMVRHDFGTPRDVSTNDSVFLGALINRG